MSAKDVDRDTGLSSGVLGSMRMTSPLRSADLAGSVPEVSRLLLDYLPDRPQGTLSAAVGLTTPTAVGD